ncbi:hypothetical protein BDR26DRAFT_858670 [Obelidium mucronatum]|nr:hypothetical protein BDR26DRAFT_858670 [Obelidium mucronatum]
MKLLVVTATLAGFVNAICNNLGGWLPRSDVDQYSNVPTYMTTSDSFKNCMVPSSYMGTCMRMPSPSYGTFFVLQPDGNAVIYSIWYAATCNYGNGCTSPIWSTGTVNSGAIAVKLSNGKFFVDTALGAGGLVKWDSGKTGSVSGTKLCIQNDANLVLYDTNNAVVWASGSNR